MVSARTCPAWAEETDCPEQLVLAPDLEESVAVPVVRNWVQDSGERERHAPSQSSEQKELQTADARRKGCRELSR